MVEITLVFPHHLFEEHPAMHPEREVWMTEEYLFFRQYNFHKQKLGFHRASMQFYKSWLEAHGYLTHYTASQESLSDIRLLVPELAARGVKVIHYCEPSDDWLHRRLKQAAVEAGIALRLYPSPLFLNSLEELEPWFTHKKQYFQTDFYTRQRKHRRILLEEGQKPIGGKWTFDTENRQRYPKGKQAPHVQFPEENQWHREAKQYVERHFPENYGHWENDWQYPVTFEESTTWLEQFIRYRLLEFGAFEDAMVTGESILHHSLLTPMLNIGLLTPKQILDTVLTRAAAEKILLNSLEGFIRQIIGWREFIRGVYEYAGRRERVTNYWGFKRKIPQSFWNGSTGIAPVDIVIKKVLATGYCHHIERLMVLGNFMLLCEFDPDEVYRWFMEMFIDAYDWVMVPNVYGMSQFADGGLMATKPYISGSNYLMKMSDFPKGDWQKIWDGLFWRFLHTHRHFFLKNPRLGMLVNTFDKMPEEKRQAHLHHANEWLDAL